MRNFFTCFLRYFENGPEWFLYFKNPLKTPLFRSLKNSKQNLKLYFGVCNKKEKGGFETTKGKGDNSSLVSAYSSE